MYVYLRQGAIAFTQCIALSLLRIKYCKEALLRLWKNTMSAHAEAVSAEFEFDFESL